MSGLLDSLIHLENRTFAAFHRLEVRWWKRAAVGYHAPTSFERRVLRLIVCAIACLVAAFFVRDHATRTRFLVLLLIALFVLFVILSLIDAFSPGSRRRPTRRK